MTTRGLENLIDNCTETPALAHTIKTAVREWAKSRNDAKPVVSGWRAFEDEQPTPGQEIWIVWPSGKIPPEYRVLDEDELKKDWSMMRWCPVPAYR